MQTFKRNEFNILKLIDSARRGADPREAKIEKGLVELVRKKCPVSANRAGLPLPTTELLRDLQLTVGIDGQNLAGVASNPMAQLAGAVRPELVLEQAGFDVITINDGQEVSLPRWRGTGGGWIEEGQTLSAAPLTLSSVAATAKHCGAQIKYSRRLRLGTDGDVQARIVTEMQRLVREQLEDGLINGDGLTGKPSGLINQATSSASFAGASPTYVELLSMVETLTDANGSLSRASWLMHPSRMTALSQTERAAGSGFCVEALGERRFQCAGLPVFASTHIPESKVILADSRAASIVYFGPPQLMPDPFSGSNSISGTTTIIVSNYVDIALAEPTLVVVGSA